MRVPLLTLTFLGLACTSTGPPRIAPENSLRLLATVGGRLAWAGLSLGMTRSDAERRLGREIPVHHETYNAEMCGDYYSELDVKGRAIRISWSRREGDGLIEAIAVPYVGGERMAYDSDLSQWAVESVPQLVNPNVEPGNACPPTSNSFLVLRDHPDDAINLKSSGEGVFFVTATGCVD